MPQSYATLSFYMPNYLSRQKVSKIWFKIMSLYSNKNIFSFASWEHRLVPLLVLSAVNESYSLYILTLLHIVSCWFLKFVSLVKPKIWSYLNSNHWKSKRTPNGLCGILFFIDWFFFSIHRKERMILHGFHFFILDPAIYPRLVSNS